MGALHAGHLKLVEEARQHATSSLFRSLIIQTCNEKSISTNILVTDRCRDARRVRDRYVYAPETDDLSERFLAYVEVEGLTDTSKSFATGHFRGVTTVVTILFNTIRPTSRFLPKRCSEVAVIKRMPPTSFLKPRSLCADWCAKSRA